METQPKTEFLFTDFQGCRVGGFTLYVIKTNKIKIY